MRYALAILAFLFAAAVAFFDPRSFFSPRTLPHLRRIADITAIEGEVTTRIPRSFQVRNVKEPGELGAQEILTTAPDSTAVIRFSGNWEIKVLPNTRVVADLEAGASRVNVTVLIGDVEIVREGEADLVAISIDGRTLRAGERQQPSIPLIRGGPQRPSPTPSPDAVAITDPEPPVTIIQPEEPVSQAKPRPQQSVPKVLPPKGAADLSRKKLSDDEISRALGSQSSRFQRCFLAHMSRSGAKNASGVIFVAFDIKSSGKAEGARLITSPFEDTTLHTCVLEVVNRTPFKSFEGDAIKIDRFPISFE